MQLINRTIVLSAVALSFAFVAGCETAPKGEVAKENLRDESRTTLRQLQRIDPSLESFLKDNAYAYAIFPNVGKGGAIVGGAYGRGAVYRGDEFLGWAELNQGSIGLQLGGQTFTEIVVFKDQGTLQEFQHKGEFTTGASASAVALKAGAARNASFYNGIAYLVRPNGGLMVDLSIQGQKFNFQGADGSDNSATASDRTTRSDDTRTTEQTTTTDSDGNRTTVESTTKTDNKINKKALKDHQSQIGQRSPNGNNAD